MEDDEETSDEGEPEEEEDDEEEMHVESHLRKPSGLSNCNCYK